MTQTKVTVSEYANLMGISIPTVYRHIKAGKLQSEEIDNALHVIIDDEQLKNSDDEGEHHRLTDENQWLREKVDELTHQVTDLTRQLDDSSKRHDTIVFAELRVPIADDAAVRPVATSVGGFTSGA
jgi:predicted site-specific integrase-resolvase